MGEPQSPAAPFQRSSLPSCAWSPPCFLLAKQIIIVLSFTYLKMRFTFATIVAAVPFLVAAAPAERRAAFTLQNGKDAQALNAKFATLTPTSSCTDGENACVQGSFAQCANGKFVGFFPNKDILALTLTLHLRSFSRVLQR
jgi:hypothetical protein